MLLFTDGLLWQALCKAPHKHRPFLSVAFADKKHKTRGVEGTCPAAEPWWCQWDLNSSQTDLKLLRPQDPVPGTLPQGPTSPAVPASILGGSPPGVSSPPSVPQETSGARGSPTAVGPSPAPALSLWSDWGSYTL